MENSNQEVEQNNIIIVDIRWHGCNKRGIELPEVFSVSIPQNILLIQDEMQFRDSIESFAYSFLTRKFGVEVSHCQVWLPLK